MLQTIMGINMGCIDCLANLQMIQMYGESVSPFLQKFTTRTPAVTDVFDSGRIEDPYALDDGRFPVSGTGTGRRHFPGTYYFL